MATKVQTIRAKWLREGQWLFYNDGNHMIIDRVAESRLDNIAVRCGYREGDNSGTNFYDPEELVPICVLQ